MTLHSTTLYEQHGNPKFCVAHFQNKSLDTAELKGARARHANLPTTRCPYPDHRTSGGQVTWSRAFRRAWLRGWRIEDGYLSDVPTPTSFLLFSKNAAEPTSPFKVRN